MAGGLDHCDGSSENSGALLQVSYAVDKKGIYSLEDAIAAKSFQPSWAAGEEGCEAGSKQKVYNTFSRTSVSKGRLASCTSYITTVYHLVLEA